MLNKKKERLLTWTLIILAALIGVGVWFGVHWVFVKFMVWIACGLGFDLHDKFWYLFIPVLTLSTIFNIVIPQDDDCYWR